MITWTGEEDDLKKFHEAGAQHLDFVADQVLKVVRLWLRLGFWAYQRHPRIHDFAIREAGAYTGSAVKLQNRARELRGEA